MRYTYNDIAQKEIGNWKYQDKVRNAAPVQDPQPARFTKCGNIWENPNAQKTNEALVMIAGDLMCQERFIEAWKTSTSPENYDFYPSMIHCAEVIKTADFAIGNLEAVTHPEAPYSNEELFLGRYYNRNAPPHFLAALKQCGFDLLTTANNHTLDTGLRGLYRTYEYLDQLQMIHTGTYIDPEEKHWSLVDVNGIKIGVINYFVFSNFDMKENITDKAAEETMDFYSLEKAKKAIAELRENGAEYIICCMHWGTELVHSTTSKQRQRAKDLADAGVDLIAGSHPHVLQPYSVVTAADGRKVPVAYSIGNLMSHFEQVPRKSSVVLELLLKKNVAGAVSCDIHYIPFYTFSEYEGMKYVPVPLTNRLPDSVKEIKREQNEFIRSIMGEGIYKSRRFDEPENLSYLVPVTEDEDMLYPFKPKESTGIQRKLLDEFRMTEAFRDLYGNYMVDRYPTGESVTTAVRVAKRYLHVDKLDLKKNRKLIGDIVYTRNVLGFRVWEYFSYGLQDKTIAERCEFLPQGRIDYIYDRLNEREGLNILNNKMRAYEQYKDFYKRDVIKIDGLNDLEKLKEFCAKHPRFIKKPLRGSVGSGVEILNIADFASPTDFCQKYHEEMPLVCEELIIADDSLSAIHPQSVNSLRVNTYFDGKKVRITNVFLRCGRGNGVIDNVSTGGIMAAVDEETGIIVTDARDETNNSYAAHPDTGFVFKGFQIKDWDKLKETADALARVRPGLRCVGWDIVLSKDKGWQVIEGNGHPMVSAIQVATQVGMRQKFLKSVEWDRYC